AESLRDCQTLLLIERSSKCPSQKHVAPLFTIHPHDDPSIPISIHLSTSLLPVLPTGENSGSEIGIRYPLWLGEQTVYATVMSKKMDRIYLDNAATSWPKPNSVYDAVDRWMRELGAPAGRSSYGEAEEVERLVGQSRNRTAQLIGCTDSRRIIFTQNGTDSLNLALHGALRPGDHVITTVAEHNSVLRPLRQWEKSGLCEVTRLPVDGSGIVNPDDVSAAIRPNTAIIAIVHVSNVTGAIQPIREIGELAKRREIRYLVDAAQSLGQLPVDVNEIQASLLAAPAHKGLLAPLGLGILYVAEGVESHLMPTRQGGTGTESESDIQPTELPARYESGNHNVPAIIGLNEGVKFLQQQGIEAIRDHHRQLTDRLIAGLLDIPGITVYGPADGNQRAGVVSINCSDYDPRELASLLDSAFGVQVRAGLHCAPLMHKQLGTASSGGTVRFSVGNFNTLDQIECTVEAVKEIACAD
ncbi:MAG: cysteine desulfurase/selenocysteine lyase, partial [Pirellulaceae bacterium]